MDSVRSKSPAYLSVLRPRPRVWKSLFTKRRATDSTTPFRYRSLHANKSETRLVTFLSRFQTKTGILEFQMEHVNLDDHVPPYAALSYVWGDSTPTVPILLNGQSHAITENLAIALRQLQHERKSLVLWIDSLCINQGDEDEKGLQVQRMGKIYSGAAVVLAWLGPEDASSTVAMTKLSNLNQWLEKSFLDIPIAEFPENMDPAVWIPFLNSRILTSTALANLKPGNDHESDVPYAFIIELLSRPYWHRLWIQQELRLARETILVCGRQDLDMKTLLAGLAVSIALAVSLSDGWSADLKSASDGLLDETGPAIPMLYGDSDDSLRELLGRATFPRSGGSLKAFDRRDMIYGLLSISNDAKVLGILPEYSKAWQDVYRGVTEAYIKQGDLTILSFAGLSPTQPGLPSWVPDWSQSLRRGPVSRHGKIGNKVAAVQQPFYSAAASSRCQYSFPWPGVLNLLGYHIDVITHIGNHFSAYQSPDDEHSEPTQMFDFYLGGTIKDLWNDREPRTSQYGDGQARSDWLAALSCALVAGTQGTDHWDQRGRGYLRWTPGCEFDRVMKKFFNPDDEFDKDAWFEGYKAYIEVVRLLDNLPFVTAKGYVGIGLGTVLPGDEICICAGASVPFVIRKNSDEVTYEFLGDVYVHGIMYGEFLTSRPQTQTFSFS